MQKRSRPDRQDWTAITIIIALLGLLWFSFAYSANPSAKELIGDIREWQTLIASIIALVGALITVNAIRKQIKVSENQFTELVRPRIVVKLEISEAQVFVLTIENYGRYGAKNLAIRMNKDFYQFAEVRDMRNIKNNPAFQNTIALYGAGEKLAFDLTQGFNVDTKKDGQNVTPSKFEITTEYEFNQEVYKDKFKIDLQNYFGANVPKTTAEHLGKISETAQKIERRLR
jgi:hypothetical protein